MKRKKESEGLSEYAERLASDYAEVKKSSSRKTNGQFFTPKSVASFMAGLFKINKKNIRLLDPGAGIGVLTASFCEAICLRENKTNLVADVFENDQKVIPLLESVLNACKAELESRGHNFSYNLHQEDFVSANMHCLVSEKLFEEGKNPQYDFVISNPPYYKLKKIGLKNGEKKLLALHPNAYTLFMAISIAKLKKGGESVFITPRSFCSGTYYKNFRVWFLERARISNIHIFESRKDVFDKDKVLQENVILRAKKGHSAGKVTISTSANKLFDDIQKFRVDYSDILYRKNGDVFITIPTTSQMLSLVRNVWKFPITLKDLGLEISTGPVVSYRVASSLSSKKNPTAVPLLWMHNIRGMDVVWPLEKAKKEKFLRRDKKTKSLILPVKNYVLIKRFSSKEQKRRVYVGVLEEKNFPSTEVALENHLNYVHRPNGSVSLPEAYGLAAFFNTRFFDEFFRCLCGHTQVNATEIRNVPLPDKKTIISLGKEVHRMRVKGEPVDFDSALASILKYGLPNNGGATHG